MGRLPWIAGLVALVLYGLTASQWLTVQSAPVTAQVAGWGGDFPANAPLLWLVTRPLMFLPAGALPLATNLLTLLFAAAVAWTLARCVQLLPQDHSHAQRIRGYTDGRTLCGRWAWVPPALACGMFLPQFTAWEHGTSMTGEMLNVLVFAHAVRSLMEFHAGRRYRWLDSLAVTVGAGMSSNWAMLGFLPFFAMGFLWIGGYEVFRWRLMLRLAGLWAAGLSLYLLPPWIAAGRGGLPEGFGEALWAMIATQKEYLAGLPKPRFILLASVMLAPLVMGGFKGANPTGSQVERVATAAALLVMRVAWLGVNLWMAFDGPFSPRGLVTGNPEAASLPLLTFHFGAALSVAQIAGYFLVTGLEKAAPQWAPIDTTGGPVHRSLAGLVIAAAVAMPAALVLRNLPAARVQNGPVLSVLAASLVQPLPKERSIILTDNPLVYILIHAHLGRVAQTDTHLVIDARRMPEAAYRRRLAEMHGQHWERLHVLAKAKENIGGEFMGMIIPAAEQGRVFSATYFLSFITETHYLRPAGAIFRLVPYMPGNVEAPRLTQAEGEAASRFWDGAATALAPLVDGQGGSRPLGLAFAASYLGRAATAQAFMLQRSAMLEPAGRLLALALKLDPNNLAAQVNLAANEHLRRGQPIPASVRKPIEAYTPGIVELFGPVDEPRHLEALGDAALTLDEPLVRTAANAFVRARELDPASLDAAIGYARTCVAANEPKLAFEAVAKAAALAAGGKPTKGQSSHLARAEANAHLRDGNLPKAQQVVLNALERLPDDLPLLDLMTFLNVQAGTPAQALPFIERVAKLKPNDDAVLQRKGHILLQAGQYDAAVAVLDSVLSRQFDDKASRMNRGTAHLLAGRPAKAAEDFQTVLRRVPTAVDAMIGLAEASIARKDKPSALRHLDAAIALLEPNAPLRSNLLARVASVRAAP